VDVGSNMEVVSCLNANVECNERMSGLLSPTECKFCQSNLNLQRFKFPCDCLIYAHPDCYAEYSSETRERAEGRWRLWCPQCKMRFTMPENTPLQIIIHQDEDEYRPITRKEVRKEQCKICAILSVQSTCMLGMLGVLIWGYTKIFMDSF
jgi:hypothetical protein